MPQILADGTHKMPAIPTPKRKYPVRMAIFVNFRENIRERVRVFAAKIGPRDVAKIETTERMRRITSRFQSGQFYYEHVSLDLNSTGAYNAYKRIIGVITWLRDKNDGNRTASIAFQASRLRRCSLRSLKIIEVPSRSFEGVIESRPVLIWWRVPGTCSIDLDSRIHIPILE